MVPRSLILPLVIVAALGGCVSGPAPKPAPQLWTTSPNGEPLPFRAGQDDCQAALAAWFARADTNLDGVLDLGEMQADAARWFALADLDHDGQITSDELSSVRQRLLPTPEPEPEPEINPRGRPQDRMMPRRSLVRLDPVMQADANADFRVSTQEFRAYVAAQFVEREKHGVIVQSQILDACSRP